LVLKNVLHFLNSLYINNIIWTGKCRTGKRFGRGSGYGRYGESTIQQYDFLGFLNIHLRHITLLQLHSLILLLLCNNNYLIVVLDTLVNFSIMYELTFVTT